MQEIKKEDSVIKLLLSLLVFSAFASGLTLQVSSATINLSQLLSIVLFGALMIYSAANRRRVLVVYGDATSLFLYLYFFSNFFSSVLFSTSRGHSLKSCVVLLSYVFIYITVRWAIKLMVEKRSPVKTLMAYGGLTAGFGLLCMVVAFLTNRENIGVSFGHLAQSGIHLSVNIPSITSLSIEPNIFGIISAVVLCIYLSVYLLWEKTNWNLVIIIILSLGVLFSYTRSAYISLAVAMISLLILSRRIKLLISLFNYCLIVIVLIAAIIVLLPPENKVKTVLANRANSLFEFNKGSGLGRVYGYQIGVEGLKKNMLFGIGTLSAKTAIYNRFTHEYQELLGSAGWLNGVWIQSLHDTGIFGLLIVLGIYASVMFSSYRMFKRVSDDYIEKSILLGFIGGNIVLIIASQLSSTLWISFPYVYWAINVAYVAYCNEKFKRPERITDLK